MMDVPLPLRPDHGGVVTSDGLHFSSREDAFGALIGLCGCGRAEQLVADALRVFRLCDIDGWPDGGFSLYEEALLHMLDNAELIEHGTSIGHSWMTETGEAWLAEMEGEAL